MYAQHFKLQRDPFGLTADPEFLYMTEQHREAVAALVYAVLFRKGLVVLTGEAGTGKTTLLTWLLQSISSKPVGTSMIVNPILSPSEFLEAAMLDFGLENIPESKPRRLALLQSFLWKTHSEGKTSALIIDEAHKLSLEVLEEVRLLGNLESGGQKLLQIALVGQSELDDLLNTPQLRQFKQRVAHRLTIRPLTAADTGAYIQYRWMKAGGKEAPFSSESIGAIADAARGIPRVINVICDNALTYAFASYTEFVEIRHVTAACRDLMLDGARPVFQPPVQPAMPEQPIGGWVVSSPPQSEVSPMHTPRPSWLMRIRNRFRPTQRIEIA